MEYGLFQREFFVGRPRNAVDAEISRLSDSTGESSDDDDADRGGSSSDDDDGGGTASSDFGA